MISLRTIFSCKVRAPPLQIYCQRTDLEIIVILSWMRCITMNSVIYIDLTSCAAWWHSSRVSKLSLLSVWSFLCCPLGSQVTLGVNLSVNICVHLAYDEPWFKNASFWCVIFTVEWTLFYFRVYIVNLSVPPISIRVARHFVWNLRCFFPFIFFHTISHENIIFLCCCGRLWWLHKYY